MSDFEPEDLIKRVEGAAKRGAQSGSGETRDGLSWTAIGVLAAVLLATIGFGMNQNARLARLEESIAGERGLNYRMDVVEQRIGEVATALEGSDAASGLVGHVMDIKTRLAQIEEQTAKLHIALGVEEEPKASIAEPAARESERDAEEQWTDRSENGGKQ